MKKISEKSIKSLELLENNYRLIYTFIMAAPLIRALEIVFLKGNEVDVWVLKDMDHIFLVEIILLFIYLAVYIRFLLGDFRYLDLKYLQHQNESEYIQRYSPLSRFIDFGSLIIHAIFFYILATAISNFTQFYMILIMLLTINSAWLLFVYWTTSKENRQRLESKSSFGWAINNIVCSLLLLIFFQYADNFESFSSVIVFLAIVLANTIVDYALAWKMYFPKIQEEIIELK